MFNRIIKDVNQLPIYKPAWELKWNIPKKMCLKGSSSKCYGIKSLEVLNLFEHDFNTNIDYKYQELTTNSQSWSVIGLQC